MIVVRGRHGRDHTWLDEEVRRGGLPSADLR